MNILFVCTGNTCRSSMAEALFAQMLGNSGLEGIEIKSAGVAAERGAPATSLAVQALQELGVDLTSHRASSVDGELVNWADLILTMTERHKDFLVDVFPEAADKTYILKEYVAAGPAWEENRRAFAVLEAAMDAKERAFAEEVRPNIEELQAERRDLLQQLSALDKLLAERHRELSERLSPEWELRDELDAARASLDVADPFGHPLPVYRASREELRETLDALLQKLRRQKP